MKNFLSLFLLLIGVFIFSASTVSAQMVGFPSTVPQNPEELKNLEDKQNEGKNFLTDVLATKKSCASLSDDQFEKIGDFTMFRMVGSTESHLLMDQRMEQMMGEDAEKAMHVAMGKRMTGCETNLASSNFMANGMMQMMMGMSGGGGFGMMGSWGFGNMMNGGNFGAFSAFSLIYSVLILVILVLLIAWLWKQIQKK